MPIYPLCASLPPVALRAEVLDSSSGRMMYGFQMVFYMAMLPHWASHIHVVIMNFTGFQAKPEWLG